MTDNNIHTRKSALNWLKTFRSNYKNWLSLLFKYKVLKLKKLRVVTRGGESAELTAKQFPMFNGMLAKKLKITLSDYLNDIFYYNGLKIVMHGMSEGNGDVLAVFGKQDYVFLKPKNEVVIDIGANIGDTAVYFALKGAKKVIALEPYVYSYKSALKNIKENKLEDKIILLNAGYGEDKEIIVDPNKITKGDSYLEDSKNGLKIPIYSLGIILQKYKIKDAILKMDCEGCEYNLLNESEKTLRSFSRIELEFHYGYKNLEQKLKESGFSVKILWCNESKGNNSTLREMALNNGDYTIGMLYAELI